MPSHRKICVKYTGDGYFKQLLHRYICAPPIPLTLEIYTRTCVFHSFIYLYLRNTHYVIIRVVLLTTYTGHLIFIILPIFSTFNDEN